MIKVIIADNQTLTSEGVKALLHDIIDIEIVGSAKTGIELDYAIDMFSPGLLIIDPNYSHRLTLHDVRNIRSRYKTLPLLVLSNRQDKNRVQEVINTGVKNHVFKECSREELIHAIYSTVKGEQFYCRNTYEVLFGSKLIPEKEGAIAELSPRELELMQMVVEGLTNKEIAERLFLSIHTVKTHRKNIIKKIGFTFKNIADVASLLQSGHLMLNK